MFSVFISAFTLLIRFLLDYQLVHGFSVPMLHDKISRIPQPLSSHPATAAITPVPQFHQLHSACHAKPDVTTCFTKYASIKNEPLFFVLPCFFFQLPTFFPTFELDRLISNLKRFVSNLSVFPPLAYVTWVVVLLLV